MKLVSSGRTVNWFSWEKKMTACWRILSNNFGAKNHRAVLSPSFETHEH
jgi:hypothetical protein